MAGTICQVRRTPRVGLRGGRYRSYSLAERLAARTVSGEGGCLDFLGCKVGPNGYGQIMRDPATRKLAYAHIVAWELAYGAIPAGLKVCHRCDNPRCVNPSHLFLGTQADNIHDCIRKGRRNAFGRQKLQAGDVVDIRARAARGESHRSIAARYGVRRQSVTGIVNRRSWQHLDDTLAGVPSPRHGNSVVRRAS